jgi:hypothetical protein
MPPFWPEVPDRASGNDHGTVIISGWLWRAQRGGGDTL